MTAHTMMNRQLFAERLTQLLSEADFPRLPSERAADFAKIFDLDVITAERIIDGLTLPSETLLEAIATEFEVKSAWLKGQG
jgi:hypothetical protein